MGSRFFALRSRAEHARANRELARVFRTHGQRVRIRLHEVGAIDAHYVEPVDVWLAAHELPNRYRNAFGPGNPAGVRNLWPSIQLNLALEPGSSKPRARFMRDAAGCGWVAHSGTLGGRQTGISRDGFLRLVGGARRVMIDDKAEELVVLGTIAQPQALLEEIARITHAASQFREALAAGLT